MGESRTMTAIEAERDEELWERVQRGECRVFRGKWYGRGAYVAALYNNRANRAAGMSMLAIHGEYDWQADGNQYDIPDDDPLTIEDLSVGEQSENSPANIDRLKARIAELEIEVERLKGYLLRDNYEEFKKEFKNG